jgi:hypothetical protein
MLTFKNFYLDTDRQRLEIIKDNKDRAGGGGYIYEKTNKMVNCI